MKSILILLLTFFSAFPAAAQNPDKNIEQQYKDAGIKDAEILQKVYDKLHKPLYQQAYDDYASGSNGATGAAAALGSGIGGGEFDLTPRALDEEAPF